MNENEWKNKKDMNTCPNQSVLDREAIVTIIQDIPNFFQLIGLNSQDIKHLPSMFRVGASCSPTPTEPKRWMDSHDYEKFLQIWGGIS